MDDTEDTPFPIAYMEIFSMYTSFAAYASSVSFTVHSVNKY